MNDFAQPISAREMRGRRWSDATIYATQWATSAENGELLFIATNDDLTQLADLFGYKQPSLRIISFLEPPTMIPAFCHGYPAITRRSMLKQLSPR